MNTPIEYDETAYAVGRPFGPDRWRTIAPDMPAGLYVVRDAFPPGMLVMQSFLDPAFCDALVAECNPLPGIRQGSATGGYDVSTTYRDGRTSETVDIYKLQTDVVELTRRIFESSIAPHYGCEFEWYERPEILRYNQGGEYKPHSDSDNWFAEEKVWRRVLDRDISILLYLNENYGGGEIAFPNFGVKLKPKRGMLIAFPSDCRFIHTARPVETGIRYALVSWAAVRGSARVQEKPGDIIRM